MVNVKRIIYCILAVLILPVWLSCSSTTGSGNDQNLTGKVLLDGQASGSGVRVSLYSLVSLDTALVRINQEYPNIGIQISQETEFDHRLTSSLFSVTTNEAGEWNLGKVSGGPFNIVFEKDGFGARYIHDVDVTTSRNLSDITLFPIDTLRQFLDGNKTLQSGRTYILEGDYFVLADSRLTIEDEVTVIAEQNARIIVSGEFERVGSNRFSRFTAATTQRGEWRGIEFGVSPGNLDKLILDYANTGLLLTGSLNRDLRNLHFKNNDIGIITSNISTSNQFVLENINFYKGRIGIQFGTTNNLKIDRSVFFKLDDEGINIAQSSIEINNNYFLENLRGLVTVIAENLFIKNCEFENNSEVDIWLRGSVGEITDNILTPVNFGIKNKQNSEFSIRNNSFNGNNIALDNSFNAREVDANGNWWNTTSLLEIESRVIHVNDGIPGDTLTRLVDFTNFLTSPPLNIGIQ